MLSLSRGRTGNKAGGINQIASCPVPPCPAAAIFYLQLNKERRDTRASAVYNFPISEMRLHPHPFSAHFARGKRDRGIPRRQTDGVLSLWLLMNSLPCPYLVLLILVPVFHLKASQPPKYMVNLSNLEQQSTETLILRTRSGYVVVPSASKQLASKPGGKVALLLLVMH